ncbi:MAG: 6-phosphogluconolactonase, partial [Micromonosporaceae bacterium]|nr:6-phosphogluconolactonase [Micromonosporaceae bacterium]
MSSPAHGPVVLPDAALLAEAVAARLSLAMIEAQSLRGEATLVLTGGTIAARVYAVLGSSPLCQAVDWTRVNLWWSDERFLPSGHPDRNQTQAIEALLAQLPLDPARVHPMPATDGPDGDDAEAAAARYAAELAAAALSSPAPAAAPTAAPAAAPTAAPTAATLAMPRFDILLLGVGEDGHVASVFPDHPVLLESRLAVAAVHDSPKPPPVRLTLTLPAITTADEIWLVAAGAAKREVVRSAAAEGEAAA